MESSTPRGYTAWAMSEENVELARQAYGAYNRQGIHGILEYLDPAVEWRNPIESPNAGVFVGPEGVLEWQRMVDDAFEEMHFEPQRIKSFPTGESSQCFVSGCAPGPAKSPPRSHLHT